MKTQSCPLSFVKIDANVARINAFYIGLVLAIYLITQNQAFVYFLILDFATRLFADKNYSLTYTLSIKSKNLLNIQSVMVDSGAKRLATFLGLTFSILIAVCDFLNLSAPTYLISSILLLCISLEVLFNYCLGCKVYVLYKKIESLKYN
jgi:hypothetical protein